MLRIDPAKEVEKRTRSLLKICQREGYTDVLIGVSGGVDSATSLFLSVKALGKDHVHPVLLPYGALNDEGTRDAHQVIEAVGIAKKAVQIVDIKPFVDAVVDFDKAMDEGRKGNIMARMRMVILFDLSKKLNMLVVGTENKTEHLLGYYTRFGDEASDIEPIRDLYKHQVYSLAKYLGIPPKIQKKSPTAGLWEGQTDEKEFGFSYETADKILYLYSEKKLSKREIITKGFSKDVVNRVWWWIEKGEFKDRVPYSI